ncbi:cytochrome c [Gillisia sp. M10.2A]|uniref:Cytochrome c n=1 Tax=Gillisia lutea TaxID=2909668 RepID=A0ABS9EIX1_9FLAO|nr:cytochrome c [Gillisia lutea]MCF4101386.1 cytochrome c [Gillisia lutea]
MRIVFPLLIFSLLTGCKTDKKEEKEEIKLSANQVTEAKDTQSESYKRGKEVYADFCVVCHLPNGKGIPGSFPPLDGSNWLTEKRKESIHAVKYGLQGSIKVNGEEYSNVMTPLGLSDQEVADVLNYAMNSWSNKIEQPVTLEEVQGVTK